jgi:signal peptidase
MLVTAIQSARATLRVLWVTGIVVLFGALAVTHLLPALGHELFVVRGASMEPSIPIGSAVIVGRVQPDLVHVGDVVTFRGSNDTVITHRIIALPTADAPSFHTKGDASESADPFPLLPENIIGRVEFSIPRAGLALTMLSSSRGTIVTLGFLGFLLVAAWFMDELLATIRRSAAAKAGKGPGTPSPRHPEATA